MEPTRGKKRQRDWFKVPAEHEWADGDVSGHGEVAGSDAGRGHRYEADVG